MPSSGPPPPGGDQNIGNRLVVLQSILISVATTLVALRLYVRARIVRGMGLDDFFLVLALVRISTYGSVGSATRTKVAVTRLAHLYFLHPCGRRWAGTAYILSLKTSNTKILQNCTHCPTNNHSCNGMLQVVY